MAKPWYVPGAAASGDVRSARMNRRLHWVNPSASFRRLGCIARGPGEGVSKISPLGMCLVTACGRVWAACDWLRSATRDGHEGPLVEQACMVAMDREDNSHVLGALVVTLMIGSTRSWYSRRRLAVSPPPPHLANGQDQPQVSWPSVQPGASDQGVATRVGIDDEFAMENSGYRELASATDGGNVISMAWHWRNGFRLLPHRES